MSVVGIDFGSGTCRVAVARRAAIQLVRNEESSRATPTMVGYSDQERFIGCMGEARQRGNFKNTVTEVKRLIRRPAGESFQNGDAQWLLYETTASKAGYINVKVNYRGDPVELTPEQVFGALLVKLKETTSAACDGERVKDIVISCPDYFADSQRQAVLEAASIADLHVLRIMNESTAAALNYGILRPLPKDGKRRVAIVDVGEQHTTCTIVDFTEGKLTVLGSASHANLGARDFDRVLFNHFNNEFKQKYNKDLKTKPKSVLRLMKECKKIKKQLTANKNAFVSVECILGDYDMDLKIDRETFEGLAAPYIKEANIPCEQACKVAGVSKDEIESIEIIGGGVRIPAVQASITEFFGKAVSRTLDGDESICRGCALQCAMLSPQFRVKNFEVVDRVRYPVTVRWGPVTQDPSDESESQDKTISGGNSPLFTTRDSVPCTKIMTFKIPSRFQIQAKYTNPETLPAGVDPFIGRFIVNVPKAKENAKSTSTKVRFKIDINSMLAPPTATFVEVVPIADAATDAPAPMETDSPASDGATPKPEEKSEETPATDDAGKGLQAEAASAEPPKKKKKKTTTSQKTDIAVDSLLFYGTPEDVLKEFQALEAQMQKNDEERKLWDKSRNDLESYILSFRDQLYDELNEYVDPDTRSKIINNLQTMEDWMYDEGDNASLQTFQEKLGELKVSGDPISRRKWESDRRETAVSVLKKTIINFNKLVANVEEKYAHIPPEDRETAKLLCTTADRWLLDMQQKQDKLQKTDDPVLLVADLQKRAKELKDKCEPIFNKSEPAAPNPKALEEERAAKKAKDAAEKAEKEAAEKKKAEEDGAGKENKTEENDAEMTEAPKGDEQAEFNGTPPLGPQNENAEEPAKMDIDEPDD